MLPDEDFVINFLLYFNIPCVVIACNEGRCISLALVSDVCTAKIGTILLQGHANSD